MNTRKLEKIIKQYNIVSFDIFDTLLKRDVYKPIDVFELVQRESIKRFGKGSGFKKVRTDAEKIAREKSKYPEITLDEIYEEIDIPDKDRYKALELEVESNILHRNYDIKPLYDMCRGWGMDIYIISDMYLPRLFLEKILIREGYTGFKAVVLSADYRKTKRSGELYRAFIEKYDVSANEVIHIGDSRYADYIGAQKAGIKACHIPRMTKNTLYLSKPGKKDGIEKRTLYAFVNTHVRGCCNRDEQLGYEVLGPILFAYCKWIHNWFEELNIEGKRLWFAARDMYLFKEAYELLFGDENSPDYVYISRKSLRPILTASTGDIAESGNVFPRGECTVKEIIRRMGYTTDELKREVDLEFIIQPRRLSEYPSVVEALSSKSILDKEQELADAGMRYLAQHGFMEDSIVLADVGWHGTTQYILQRILDSHNTGKEIFGLYLGCLDSTNMRIGKDNYHAFAFDEEHDSEFAKGILLFESLILAPHGSTIFYQEENGQSVPVLGNPDNVSFFLKTVQTGAMKFVKEYKSSMVSSNTVLDSNLSAEAFCKMAMEPKREELETIGQMDYDDFGIGKMAVPKSIGTYVLHPKQLHHDLKYSPWRIGFIYKLLKIRLPYAKIYSLARKKQGKQT